MNYMLLAETASAAADASDGGFLSGPILMAIMTGLGILIAMVFKWLRGKTGVAAEVERVTLEDVKNRGKNYFIDQRLIPFGISTAEAWCTVQLPRIIYDALDGGDFSWRTHLDGLKTHLKTKVVEKFQGEDLDVLAYVGEDALDDLLDRIVLKALEAAPGKVRGYVPPQLLDLLTDKLSQYATGLARSEFEAKLNPAAPE